MLRVLHVSSGDLWAGAEAQLFHLLRALRAQEEIHTNVVVFNRGELERRVSGLGLTVDVIDEGVLGPGAMVRRLVHCIGRHKPTIVHTHGFKENVLGATAALFAGAPRSIRTVHGGSEIAPALWQLKKRAAHALDAFVGRRLQQGAVIVSDTLARHLRGGNMYRAIWTIKNGIDVDEVRRQASEGEPLPPSEAKRVGIIARLVQVKRVDLFLKVAAELRRDGRAAEFFIVGDGPLRENLEQQARALGLETHVRFLGFRTDSLSLMRQMDTVMFTSDHEGMPMAALEALALGVPIVSRAVGGLTELINDSTRGVLVDSSKPELLAAGVRQVLDRSSSVRNRPSLLAQEYTTSQMVQRYVELYRQLSP